MPHNGRPTRQHAKRCAPICRSQSRQQGMRSFAQRELEMSSIEKESIRWVKFENRVSANDSRLKRRKTMPDKPSVLITGASSGIGSVYADRFAKRGHDLVLVARDNARMETLANRLRRETGVEIDILRADLTDARDIAQVEARLRDDDRIGILVNNAG